MSWAKLSPQNPMSWAIFSEIDTLKIRQIYSETLSQVCADFTIMTAKIIKIWIVLDLRGGKK